MCVQEWRWDHFIVLYLCKVFQNSKPQDIGLSNLIYLIIDRWPDSAAPETLSNFKGIQISNIQYIHKGFRDSARSCENTRVCLYHRSINRSSNWAVHNDVIKWNHFPCYWPFVRGSPRSPVNYPHKRQWRGALRISLICAWINGWGNNGEAGDWRRYRAHYDVIVMWRAFFKIRYLSYFWSNTILGCIDDGMFRQNLHSLPICG